LWAQAAFCLSTGNPDVAKVPCELLERLTDALCYAA
jgi:hypothetical protein